MGSVQNPFEAYGCLLIAQLGWGLASLSMPGNHKGVGRGSPSLLPTSPTLRLGAASLCLTLFFHLCIVQSNVSFAAKPVPLN